MEVDWLDRWANNKIGFHQDNINSRLKKFWPELEGDKDTTVFVPLCGKSADMLWLRDQGAAAIGIELSEIACRDFFKENNIEYSISKAGNFTRYSAEQITLLQGDFFDLSPSDLDNVSAVYDRAALIALPPDLRIRYASHMAHILKPETKVLLISMAYDQNKMNGPPFSVSEQEVNDMFINDFNIEVLSRSSGPDIVGNLKERGLDSLDETVYLLQRNSETTV